MPGPFSFIANFLRESGALYRFLKKVDKEERDIVFYAEDKASYSYFEGLIEELTKKHGLTVYYATSDPEDPLFKTDNPNLKLFYIKKLLFLFTLMLDSKLLVMTMPDLHLLHVKRSTKGAHHLYLFHNIGSSFPVIRFGAIFHYDTVLCSGPHHVEEIRKQEELYDLTKKNLVEFGYYKLEKVRKDFLDYKKNNPDRKLDGRKARILLGPSWGEQSILDLCGAALIKILLDAGFELIVRPHPMTRKVNPKLLDSLNAEFKSHPNYSFDDDISGIESLFTSDILICDWSGLTYEYAFGTERPVLFIDVPRKIVNERYKEVGIEPIDEAIRERLGALIGPDELEKVPAAIEDMIENREKYVDEIRRAREEFVYNFGSSSKAGAKFIRDFVESGKLECLP